MKPEEDSLTFASRRAEAKEVDLAAIAVKAADAGLALALSRNDVTLPVSGANGVAVAPVDKPRVMGGHQRMENRSADTGPSSTGILFFLRSEFPSVDGGE